MTTIMRQATALFVAVLLTACATQHPAFLKGQELLGVGQWEEGITYIEIAMKEEPNHLEYRTALIDARSRAVSELLRQAGLLLDAGRYSESEAYYRRALRIAPEETRAISGLQQVAAERRRGALLREAEAALDKKDLRAAEQNVRSVLLETPRHPRALALLKRIDERKPRASTAVEASAAMRKPITLQFRDANLRVIFDTLSNETGISFVLDRDIPAAARATIIVKNTPVEEAVESLISTNALAKKVVNEFQVLIYPNTPVKVREYQDLVIRSFYLQSADVKQMLTLLRTILKSQNIFIDEKRNLLVIRDTPEAIRLAEKLIAAHDQVEPEVMLEVEILEVSRRKDNELGVRFPDQVAFGVVNPIALDALTSLNRADISVTTGSGTTQSLLVVNLKKQYEIVNLLANPRIRVRNKEKAKIHVGDRLPTISTALTASGGTGLTSQAINYLDTGIKLEVEPQVFDDDVMIKIGLEISTAGAPLKDVTGAIAYPLSTRNATTTLTLKDGETQILAGLISDGETETINKLPGLGDIPGLGRLFTNSANKIQKTEVVLSITPRIVRRLERPSADLAEYWSGPESNVRSGAVAVPSGAVPRLEAVPAPKPGASAPVISGAPVPVAPSTLTPTPIFPSTSPPSSQYPSASPSLLPPSPAPTVTPTPPTPTPAPTPTPPAPAPGPGAPPVFFQPPPGVGQ
jgi:general secretion pathway protein D